jgi:sulfotransferase family protein
MVHRSNQTKQPMFVSVQTSAFSGATLLAFLLGAHPEIATVGEMNGLIARENPDTYLCSCGQPIKECAFWRAVGDAMRERGHVFDVAHFDTELALGGPRPIQYLRRGSFRNNTLDAIRDALFLAWPGERRRVRALVARNVAFVESVLQVTGKRVFVDTSKDRLRLNALRRFSSLDVRAIHLVRDVRGVVASRLQRGALIDTREAARQWTRLHQRLQVVLQVLPEDKRLQVRYEDICRDAQGALVRLYDFCGVAPDLPLADFGATEQHIVGNPMRLDHLREIRLDERWRNVLTPDQINDIHRVAGPLNYQYGYQR